MSERRAAIEEFEELPQSSEWKLWKFEHTKRPIKVLKLLHQNGQHEPTTATHGYVFSVLIDSNPYALKMFKFFDVETDKDELIPLDKDMVSDDEYESQRDPFYAECRAYGCIYSKKRRNTALVVRCFGFISVPARMEKTLTERFNVEKWNRPEHEYDLRPEDRSPFRALVKTLVTRNDPLSQVRLRKMRDDVDELRRIGVFPMDVSLRNFVGGRLVDFGSS
ncbi:hypothetical protein EV356DRAFT_339455 [Viridothelium virens]|uniref:Protein kinase domain-containing protein n=1 Tax=Viridothelium virens TaxID=1048519 RepID=A0A6A6GXF9_VIRVR|nr:hypothetical protein EV356DRAFT_339455 [Viridothelium virens]